MTKFLKQTCTLERVSEDESGEPIINAYGELTYGAAITIYCRRERLIRDVEVANGAIVRSSNQYFTVEEIGMNDKLDGHVILIVKEYTNSAGETEGYRSIT